MARNYFIDYYDDDNTITVDVNKFKPIPKTKEDNYFIRNFNQKQEQHLLNKMEYIESSIPSSEENIEILKEQSRAKEKQENYDFPQMEQLGLLGDYYSVTSKLRLYENQLNILNNSNSNSNKKKRRSFKQMRQVLVLDTDRERIESNIVSLEEKRKEIEMQLRQNYEMENSWWQRLGAGMATEVLRQYSDPRQWNSLTLLQFLGTPIGGTIASKLGITGGISKKLFETGSGAVGEMFEEAIDEYVTDKNIDPENVAWAGLASFVLGNTINVGKKTVSEITGAFKGKNIPARGNVYIENIKKNKGNISKTNKELAKATTDNLKPILESLGKPELEKEILKKSITINGKTVQEINEILKSSIDTIIASEDIPLKTENEVVELLKNDRTNFIKIINEIISKDDTKQEIKENLIFLRNSLDDEVLKDVDVNMVKFQEETSNVLNSNKTEFKQVESKDEFDETYEALKEEIDNPKKTEDIEIETQNAEQDEFDKIYTELKSQYDSKEVVKPNGEVITKKAPENPLEQAVGVIDEEFNQTSRINEVEKSLQRELDLDIKAETLTNDTIKKINLNMIEKIGKIISEKTGLKNLNEIVDFYKNKYGVDIKFAEVETLKGKGQKRLGELVITDLDTGKEFYIKIPKELSNEAKIGTFRHELQHILDNIKSPDFKSKEVGKVNVKQGTALNVLKETQKGHFLDFKNNWWEYSYILNYRINNLITENGINRESVKVLGLDIPEILDETDIKTMKEITDSIKNVDDIEKRLEWLRKKTSTYFAVKKAIKSYQTSRLSTGSALNKIYDALETLVIRPFKKLNEQAVSRMIKSFEVEIDGNVYNAEKLIHLFYGTGTDLNEFLFRGAELPEKLQEYSDVFDKLKTEWNTIIDEMLVGTDVTRDDIINSAFYSEVKIIEDILGKRAKRFKDAVGELDVEKLQKSENYVIDPLTKKDISKALLDIREIFAEKFSKFFYTDLERLEILLKNKEVNGKLIAETLEGVKKCVSPDEFNEIITKNNLDEIEEVKKFLSIEETKNIKRKSVLENNLKKLDEIISNENVNGEEVSKILRRLKNYMTPEEIMNIAKEKGVSELDEVAELFKNEKFLKVSEIDYQKNIEDSRKRNAKLFFVGDMQSHKGNAKENKNIDSWLHRLTRFQWAKDNALISNEQLTAFVKANSVMEDFGIQRLVQDLGSAYAIKNTIPGGGIKGLNRLLNQIEDEIISREKKTYTRNIQKYIEAEIGEKLGVVTKGATTLLDRVRTRLIKIQNQASLSGRKALFELIQEPLNMFRGGHINYGGHGAFGIYKQLIKSIIVQLHGKEGMDLATGKQWYNGIALEVQNMVDDLDDFTGYRKRKLRQDGSKLAKLVSAFDTGMEKINLYKYTQALLDRASLFESGYIMKKITKYDNLKKALSILSENAKEDITNIGITEKEFYFMKKFKDTEAFKKYGVFSENEFYDVVSNKELEEIFGDGKKLSSQELEILKESVVKKVTLLHEKINSRVAPTEATGVFKYKVDNEEDIVMRNVQAIKNNFTSSIQTMWGRMIKDFYYSNVSKETGKFNASNSLYWKRLTRYALESGITLGMFSLFFNPDFYSDPIEVIEDSIDDILDEPTSALENYFSSQFNPWILTSGSTVVERPLRFVKKASKGDVKGTSEEFIKLMLGTTNYNDAKFLYEIFEDDF